MKLKPLNEQVVVIAGASSGIGRETALRCAARGAKVVVAARDEVGLASLVGEIGAAGGQATAVGCDVADFAQVEAVAAKAVAAFGRIDTWVNVAAAAVYASFEETTPDEFRRVMDVNFMGQVHGFQAALPHLRREGRGALIAITSVEAIVALPLHSAYAASKHAVEGVVDALRRELLAEGAPISVTSIKPATINTPFFNTARNKMEVEPKGPPPIYQPGVVADCVLYAAEHPVRDLFAGGAAKMMVASQALAPRLMDAALAKAAIPLSRTDRPETDAADALFAPRADDNRTEGDFSGQARSFSLYTWLETHPKARAAAAGGLLAGAALLVARPGSGAAPAPEQRTASVDPDRPPADQWAAVLTAGIDHPAPTVDRVEPVPVGETAPRADLLPPPAADPVTGLPADPLRPPESGEGLPMA